MLLFGHIGITAGVVRVGDILGSSINRPLGSDDPDSNRGSNITVPEKLLPISRRINRLRDRLGSIDYRLVLIGSLLPDILDKPSWLIFGDIFPSGRAYGHTLLFSMVLFFCGLLLIRYKKTWLLIISWSSIIHLILDQMWHNPVTLWWPLLGAMQRADTTDWLSYITRALFSDPGSYIPEVIGLTIVLLMGYRLIVRKRSFNFIRTGVID